MVRMFATCVDGGRFFAIALWTACSLPAFTAAGENLSLIEQGNRQWAAGDLDQAAASYQTAIGMDPKAVDAYMKLAGLHIARQEYRAGVETFQKAIGADPNNANAFIGLAIGYLHLGSPALAEAALDEAVRIDPGRRATLEPLMARIQSGTVHTQVTDSPHRAPHQE